jgi:hypothetical protein
MPHLTPREQAYRCFAHAAPWMPLDDLHAQWAAFGRRASTEAATRATSEAFAALAEEREALHAYTHAPQWCRRTGCLVVGLHEGSMDGLRVAAMHWYAAACAPQEHTEQSVEDHGVTHEDVQFLVTCAAHRQPAGEEERNGWEVMQV